MPLSRNQNNLLPNLLLQFKHKVWFTGIILPHNMHLFGNNLSKLKVPPNFKEYYDTQIAFLELIIKVSSNVTGILAQEDEQNIESATQLEKAYQVVIGAKRQNKELFDKLLSERFELADLKLNLAKFGPINIVQNSLSAQITDIPKPERSGFLDRLDILNFVDKLPRVKNPRFVF